MRRVRHNMERHRNEVGKEREEVRRLERNASGLRHGSSPSCHGPSPQIMPYPEARLWPLRSPIKNLVRGWRLPSTAEGSSI
jgi:hypothetical protein